MLTFACWLGGASPACAMEQAGRFKTVVLAVIQAARVMEQHIPIWGICFKHDTGRACDGAENTVTIRDGIKDTGRACDGAGLTYADMVRRKG